MNRPPFNKRELRRLYSALWYAHRDRISAIDSVAGMRDAQAARDAAAFARLRVKVERLLQEKKR